MQPTAAKHGMDYAPLTGWHGAQTAAPEQVRPAVIPPRYPLGGVVVVPIMPHLETAPLGGFKKPQPIHIMDFMKGGLPYGLK